MKKIFFFILFNLSLCLDSVPSYSADNNVVLFDVNTRKEQLQTHEFVAIREFCMARETKQPDEEIPKPLKGLRATKGYGTDKGLNDFSWFMMIHSGRALAGDQDSSAKVKLALINWSTENALYETEDVHDAYYALKRALLPIIVSYTVIRNDLSFAERKQIEDWLEPLVVSVDKNFDGDVDHNNHRYLADSVLTLWGDVTGDEELYRKGKERFKIALEQMMDDGSLPLETRRGARGLWYIRQSITNLTLIAEVYKNNGENLYAIENNGKSLSLLTNYFISSVLNPLFNLTYASENYIPGPENYFLEQDQGMLYTRGGKRHYMSFSHAYINHYGDQELSSIRLNHLMQKTGYKELPLIDDFMGGNATCFWGQP